MSRQKHDAAGKTQPKTVERAEKGALTPISDSFQVDSTPFYSRALTPDKIAREGFLKFKELPDEMRAKVWRHAMPTYGTYTALIYGREEPLRRQPPRPAPLAFRVEYRLEPVPRDQPDAERRIRLDTMRAIQSVNSEAASEIRRVFPTTIACTDGLMRFNAKHDILNLSVLQCPLGAGFFERFRRYAQGAVLFAGDWHEIPRNMTMNSEELWYGFAGLHNLIWPRKPAIPAPKPECIEGFLDFLADCIKLDTFGFTYNKRSINVLQPVHRRYMHQRLLGNSVACDSSPVMNGSFYDSQNSSRQRRSEFVEVETFMAGLKGLGTLIHGLPAGTVAPQSLRGMNFGRQELHHLGFQLLLPESHVEP
ncbi:hypothetical protein J7T55_011345 [Diaporthe amygdali]|uniref:uncharacterized protein n=1 Tax=Phomopsis amygdali TaxID=1214568 RepID=UPI0022FDC44C|nr:uncharacterized protein J7T55_011345 [Diaporthe amygdali]KAJ0108851.1 hypothetical protein J7T55_011345 [Diaporthe amygdali]